MRKIHKAAGAVAIGLALASPIQTLAAEPANVVASIKPIHSLVAGVMEGVGEPHLIVRGSGSPHAHSLRPSDAVALQDADVVFWVGPELETFLEGVIDALAADARSVTLMDVVATAPDHHDGHGTHHAETEPGGEPVDAAYDEDHGHDHDHDHAHGDVDPHIWLDPVLAEAMVGVIAETLVAVDPAHAETYQRNRAKLIIALDALTEELAAQLAPVTDQPFMVFHDAYAHLADRFDLTVAGVVTVSPERPPGAARVQAVRDDLANGTVVCLFDEPQFDPRLVETLTEGTRIRRGTLDPLGADLDGGPDLYQALMRRNAIALIACLQE